MRLLCPVEPESFSRAFARFGPEACDKGWTVRGPGRTSPRPQCSPGYNRLHMRCLTLLLTCFAAASAQTPTERLNALLSNSLLVDTHVDTPKYVVDENYDLAEKHTYYEADIPRLREGHVGAVFFGIAVEPQEFPPHLWIPRALELIDAVHQQVRQHPRDIEIALTAEDIRRAHTSGRIAVLMGVEGGHMIQ